MFEPISRMMVHIGSFDAVRGLRAKRICGSIKSMSKSKQKQRCAWANSDEQMRTYHDEEWGVPMRDSRALWEMLMLEGFQAGLSWSIILRKREAFRSAFKGFDPKKVARFGEKDIARLMQDEGIVRARAKIVATIEGANIFLAIQMGRRAARIFRSGCGDSLAASRSRTAGRCRQSQRSRRRFRRS
jgi:hypothetical protein